MKKQLLAIILRTTLAAAISIGVTALVHSSVAPVPYTSPFRQSPVRAEPGDLLFISGSGFATGDRVAYQLVTNTTSVPNHPANIPGSNTANNGEATVVLNASDGLTIQLPAVMTPNQSYVFWIKNTSNDWSSGVLINDARPLWISPEKLYSTQTFGGLPRKLKVVGRNLQPATGGATHVRLKKTGGGKPLSYDLIAENDNNAATAIERYAAIVTLPAMVTANTYSVEVQRDGTSWVALSGQTLTVAGDIDPGFEISAGVPCLEDVNPTCDDTATIAAKITLAANSGGGTVVLGAGVWKLGNFGAPAPDTTYGLILPVGVSIRGTGTLTTIERRNHWNAPALFTLMGSNEVKNIKFTDVALHVLGDEVSKVNQSFLQIGPWSSSASWGDPTVIDETRINGNTFANGINGLRDGGFPIRHMYIVNNVFGGWYLGIYLRGPDSSQINRARFNLEDSIITGNTFKPGGYNDPPAQGTMATTVGAAYRLDFSENTADGHATDYIALAPPGFRAGFFHHLSNDHEMVLFSKNRGYCTGDRAGHGEFVDYDRNANLLGFGVAVNVASASPSAVSVSGTLQQTSPSDYFAKHWVHVVAGPGVGQARKITSYSIIGAQVTFNVSPAWDVQPDSSSRVSVTREYWQVYIVDNIVDNTACALAPGRENNPLYVSKSGGIQIWGSAADGALEGNVQTGTDGIFLNTNYSTSGSDLAQDLKAFVEVRGNSVTNEVNYNSYCSRSGIVVNYGSTENVDAPVLGYGISIGRNTVDLADGLRGGAIVAENGGTTPAPGYFVLVNMLIHNNAIQNLENAHPTSDDCEDYPHRRGIHLHRYSYTPNATPIARTVLVGNSYPAGLVCRFLDDGMTNTVNLDTPPPGGWCPVP